MRRGGRQWRKLRAAWDLTIAEQAAAGDPITCRRCNQPILPGQRWQLGHPDTMPVATHGHHAHDLAPEHATENEAAGARLRHTLTAPVAASPRWNKAPGTSPQPTAHTPAAGTAAATTPGFLVAAAPHGDPCPLRYLSPLNVELSGGRVGRVCVGSGWDRDGDASSGPVGAGIGRIAGGVGGGRGAGRGDGGRCGEGGRGARVPGGCGPVGAAAATVGRRAVW